MSAALKAVLFDLDGTLVDSIRLFRDSMAAIFQNYKVELNEKYFWDWHANRGSWPELLDSHGLSQIVEDPFKVAVIAELARRVGDSVCWNEGAQEVLYEFKKGGIRTGIMTNAPLAHVNLIQSKLSLNLHFDVMITGEEIGKRKKPEPFGLLLAAEKLKILPRECAYVGDQLFDMQAAQRAGMKSILFKTPEALDASGTAQYVITSLRELLHIVSG